MTDSQLTAAIRRAFGPNLPLYRAVDPGFEALVKGLVETILEAETARLRRRAEDRLAVADRCADFLRDRGATAVADKIMRMVE